MNRLQKHIAYALLLLFTIGLAPTPAFGQPALELNAEAAVLIEAHTGKVLYSKNADQPMPPASLTKIMTLLLTMEDIKQGLISPDTRVITSDKAWKTGGSTMFLNVGQEVTVEELLKGIAIVSANDACVAIAEHLYGSEAAFVQKMNQQAEELGLEHTHFMNSHGMHHPDHYMSALDIARLSAYLEENHPEAAALHTETEFTFNEIKQYNRNPLLNRFPGADGIKTGSTPEAGLCLAGSSTQEGMHLIAVVLNCPTETARLEDSEVLLNYGFRQFELATLAEGGEILATAPVQKGNSRTVNLVSNEPVLAVIPRGESEALEKITSIDRNLEAPVNKGTVAGSLDIMLKGDKLVSVQLVTGEEVNRLKLPASLWRSVTDFFARLWNKIFSRT